VLTSARHAVRCCGRAARACSGFVHLGAGLSVGFAGLAAGFSIGIVGDAGVRGTAQVRARHLAALLVRAVPTH